MGDKGGTKPGDKKLGQGQVRAGFGKQGYCKLCALEDPVVQDELDRRIAKVNKNVPVGDRKRYWYSPKKINDWLGAKGVGGASRDTVYKHRMHVANPKDRLVNAVVKRANDGYTPRPKVSETEFLDSVISIGQQRVMDDPGEVTIGQALRAAQIRSNIKRQGQDINALIQIFTSGVPSAPRDIPAPPGLEAIEGEVKEV